MGPKLLEICTKWCMLVIPALDRLREKDHWEFKARLDYISELRIRLNCIERSCLIKRTKQFKTPWANGFLSPKRKTKTINS